ncbi:MAG: hypothetical protein WD512_16245 [Candidatus Paceibacterota bacterium]
MGYIQTILGYGGNHLEIPLTLLFKPVNPNSSTLTEDDIEELLGEDTDMDVKLFLQDDIYLENNPEDRFIIIRSIDDIFDEDYKFISKNGCEIGCNNACCFCGIIISSDYQGKNKHDNETDLEDKIAKTIVWAIELKLQGRLSQDTKLVMVSNCCS